MHIGRQYKFTQFFGWTGWEAGYLIGWSLLVTLLLQVSHWTFLTIPVPILTIIGSALAIILAFKISNATRASTKLSCFPANSPRTA